MILKYFIKDVSSVLIATLLYRLRQLLHLTGIIIARFV
jgi:hypothetical protein